VNEINATDGERLRYAVHGKGSPILVHNGLVSSIGHWRYFVPHFAARHTVVTWDYRGHGGSAAPRDLATCSVGRFAEDGHAVLEASGVGPALVAGLSFGVQVALEHYRRHPGDVRALVLICGTHGHPLDRISGTALVRRATAGAARAFARSGPLGRALLALGSRTPIVRELAYRTGGAHRELCPREVLDDLFAHVAGMDPRVVGAVFASYVEHSAADMVPDIRVPTLIIAGDRDQLTPLSIAEEMHRLVPGSRLVVFPGHSHLVQVERPGDVHAAIEEFVADLPAGPGGSGLQD
jgi:pimeloyl-ACP methyl ester carboxylesterase